MINFKNSINSDKVIPVNIIFPEEIKKRIKQYALSDTSKELGGVLVGNFTETDINCFEVAVEDFIIAKHTDAHLSSLKFTAESWAEINAEMDEKYPDFKIIGWFHTHPGFGVFLSSWDMFIQENFFNLPWQIAYVVDPCHKTDGIFIWEENQILKISEDSFINELSEENITPQKNKLISESKKNKYKSWIYIVFAILIIGLIFIYSKQIIHFYKFIISHLKNFLLTL